MTVVIRFQTITKKQRAIRSEKSHHHFSKFVVFDRFRHIIIETSTCSILNLIGHRIGGESHNRNLGIVILHFPSANLTTRFVTIFDRHLDITLASNVSVVGSYDRRVNGSFYLQ